MFAICVPPNDKYFPEVEVIQKKPDMVKTGDT